MALAQLSTAAGQPEFNAFSSNLTPYRDVNRNMLNLKGLSLKTSLPI